MSKFTATVILGLALFAYLEAHPVEMEGEEISQAQSTDNNAELAAIDGTSYSVWSDFCLKSRDAVYSDIRQKSDTMSAKVYGIFFNSAEAIGREALAVTQLSAERLTAQLANPDAPIAEGTNDAENIIAEGQQSIQGVQAQPKALITAFTTTVKAVAQAVNTQFAQKLDNLKKLGDLSLVIKSLSTVCESIEQYEKTNLELFEQSKAELVKADAKYAFVVMSQVPCATSTHVTRLDGLCKFVVAAKDPITKMASTFRRSQ